jgi:hypothetical protein
MFGIPSNGGWQMLYTKLYIRMKELEIGRMEVLQGGDGWTNYAGTCGVAVATIGM